MKTLNAFLFLVVFLSALTLVLVRHQNRQYSTEIRKLEIERDALVEQWRGLQIESATWASADRVEQIATEYLGMQMPDKIETVVLE